MGGSADRPCQGCEHRRSGERGGEASGGGGRHEYEDEMRKILAFAGRSGDVGMIDIATKLQGVVEDCAVRQAGAAKQMTIGDFLSESEAAIKM